MRRLLLYQMDYRPEISDESARLLSRAVYSWLSQERTAYWSHVLRNRDIEMRRISNVPHDHYTGRLADERLIQYVQERLSPKRVWSASQLNDLGVCGFRYFAKRLLKLDAIEEPDEGMDVKQRGTLVSCHFRENVCGVYAFWQGNHP